MSPTDLYRDSHPDTTSAEVEQLICASEKIVAIDFDGVLHSYVSGWTGHIPKDPPTPGALEFVEWLLDLGWNVVIYSARAKQQPGADGIREWLADYGFPELPISDGKPTACVYIDDRALRFEGFWDNMRWWFEDAARLRPWCDYAATEEEPGS